MAQQTETTNDTKDNTTNNVCSEIPAFFKKTVQERLNLIGNQVRLTEQEKATLIHTGSLNLTIADNMLENVIGTYSLPMGIATNFIINGKDYLIPMVLEEPSVVAAASNAAKLARSTGGFKSTGNPTAQMIAQVQLVGLPDWTESVDTIEKEKESLLGLANSFCPTLVGRGGGAIDLNTRIVKTKRGPHLVVHIIANVGDSMGANFVTKMAEGIAPRLEDLTGARVRLRILSNLSINRVFEAEAVWSKKALEPGAKAAKMEVEELVEAILDSWALADADPFRAATHNKGIMNGIDAVLLATGNDFRAVEAGAHAYAAYNRENYGALTEYEKTDDGGIRGKIRLPLSVATAGGVTQVHPCAKIANKILGTTSSQELGCIIAAVGLAQNFAALRALSSEGIAKGHMRLHAKNVAMVGGARGRVIQSVATIMANEGSISTARAKELVMELCHLHIIYMFYPLQCKV
eukprot:TRINITY_DN1851_c0_g2_i1.p1 TRINITY_DN1851_c0_g2~~TRINITY_DN1851_c0_g2_i1.p1  ORF type:complete len:463 (-),score=75.22 TRINITY_DN1851_c0_g2_i1:83-1471(-)